MINTIGELCIWAFMFSMLACVIAGPVLAIVYSNTAWLMLDFAALFLAI